MSVPISITKLMTAVVTADARLNMSEEITLQSIDFAGAGGKNSSSTLRVGDTMNRAEALLFALMNLKILRQPLWLAILIRWPSCPLLQP